MNVLVQAADAQSTPELPVQGEYQRPLNRALREQTEGSMATYRRSCNKLPC